MAETLPLAATSAGELRIPPNAHAVVVVVEGDPARQKVLRSTLHHARFATLQIDLDPVSATSASAMVRSVTERLLVDATWIATRTELAKMPIGIFGSELGGAAALAAAASKPDLFRALVLRDGRPHLAGSVLNEVRAPTLLIVDAQDDGAIAMNQETMTRVRGIAELEVLAASPAAHDDAETIAHVARLARRWFGRFLA